MHSTYQDSIGSYPFHINALTPNFRPCYPELTLLIRSRARFPKPEGIVATTVCVNGYCLSIARPVSPYLPPARLPALQSIAVAGPTVPFAIAPCRRTSPSGSNSPAIAARALPAPPLSKLSSAAILNAGFLTRVLPSLDVAIVATISSSPGRARAAGVAPPATPGKWTKPLPT